MRMTSLANLLKMPWLSLLAICLKCGLVESRLLRGLATTPENATACLTEDQCRQKFQGINLSGYFYVNSWPTKGCFSKNSNVYFGTNGTIEEMSKLDLPGIQERIWCDRETEAPTINPFNDFITDGPTTQPTQKPVTDIPTERPTAKPVSESPSKQHSDEPVTDSPTEQPTPKPVSDSPTTQPTFKPVTESPTQKPSVGAKPVTESSSKQPSTKPVTESPTVQPTAHPHNPTKPPTLNPVTDSRPKQPSAKPVTDSPTEQPTAIEQPTARTVPDSPTTQPTINSFTNSPANQLSFQPMTDSPSNEPTENPFIHIPAKMTAMEDVLDSPTQQLTTESVTDSPVKQPSAMTISGGATLKQPHSHSPTTQPSQKPVTDEPTEQPTTKRVIDFPSWQPTLKPVSSSPTKHIPTKQLTAQLVINSLSEQPTLKPATDVPTRQQKEVGEYVLSDPTLSPIYSPRMPSDQPTANAVANRQTNQPTQAPDMKDSPIASPIAGPVTGFPIVRPVTNSPSTQPIAVNSVTGSHSEQPTPKQILDSSVYAEASPTNQPAANPTANSVINSAFTDSPTKQPTSQPTGNIVSGSPTQHPSANRTEFLMEKGEDAALKDGGALSVDANPAPISELFAPTSMSEPTFPPPFSPIDTQAPGTSTTHMAVSYPPTLSTGASNIGKDEETGEEKAEKMQSDKNQQGDSKNQQGGKKDQGDEQKAAVSDDEKLNGVDEEDGEFIENHLGSAETLEESSPSQDRKWWVWGSVLGVGSLMAVMFVARRRRRRINFNRRETGSFPSSSVLVSSRAICAGTWGEPGGIGDDVPLDISLPMERHHDEVPDSSVALSNGTAGITSVAPSSAAPSSKGCFEYS